MRFRQAFNITKNTRREAQTNFNYTSAYNKTYAYDLNLDNKTYAYDLNGDLKSLSFKHQVP